MKGDTVDDSDYKHLDRELFEEAEAGDPRAVEIKRQVDRINRAVEVLLGWDLCPNCLRNNLDAKIDLLVPQEGDYHQAA
jgi:hypothetical protein